MTVTNGSETKEKSSHNTFDKNEKGIRDANFEEAISATGYGKFNFLLFLSIIPVSWATTIDTGNISMILTPAECDLELSMLQKGILNSATYAGMFSSSLMWGFLADIFGRRNILVYGFMADGICNIFSGLSQNTWVLVGFKFFSGFIVSGAYASIMSYCAEFHVTKSRPKILLRVAIAASFGNIVNGVLALLVIPRDWCWSVYNESSELIFQYNSWRIFLTLCGVPTLLGAICLKFFPESPKFLMSQGRNEEAIEIFKTMYSINTGKPKNTYPIQSLEDEVQQDAPIEPSAIAKSSIDGKSFRTNICNGMRQMKPLFSRMYFTRLLMVVLAQYGAYMSTNTIRLWQPHVFGILERYDDNGTSPDSTFCKILDGSHEEHNNETLTNTHLLCSHTLPESFVYTNNLIVAFTSIIAIFVAGIVVSYVNIYRLLVFTCAGPLCFLLAMNWSTSTTMTLGFICSFVALMGTTSNLIIAITVNLFPTSLRTTAVCLTMMLGRVGAVSGSIMFPILLQHGCFISIIALASFVLMCLVVVIFIPKPSDTVK